MHQLDLGGLRVFREIVEAGSFAAAAERLNVAPPIVSKQLARLEGKLGTRLLHRSSRRMSLTEAGSTFYEQCRQALDILDAAASSIGKSASEPRGELKVSAPAWCATSRFAELLLDYRRRHPEVRFDLHFGNRMVDLIAEGFDVALRVTAAPAEALVARRLCRIDFQLVAAPEFLRGAVEAPTGVRRVLDAVLPNYLQPGPLKAQAFSAGNTAVLDAVMKSSDTTFTYHAVLAGAGAAYLPSWLIADDLVHGRLVKVDGHASGHSSTLFAVFASGRQVPPKLKTFVEFLSSRLTDSGSE